MRSNTDEIGFGAVDAFQIAVGFVERMIGLAQFLVQPHQVLNQTGIFQRDSGLVGERA